jgi:hypothetical protein
MLGIGLGLVGWLLTVGIVFASAPTGSAFTVSGTGAFKSGSTIFYRSTTSGTLTFLGTASRAAAANFQAGYAARVDSTANLRAYWRLGEVSGTSAKEMTGLYNGTYVGGPTLGAPGAVASDADRAVTFTGSAGSAVSATTIGNVSGSFTVETWAKPSAPTGGILGSRTSGQDFGFDLTLIAGKIHGDVGTGTAWLSTAMDANYTYTAGTWYHIAYVIAPGAYTIYLNGMQVGAGTLSAGTPLLTNTKRALGIGGINVAGATPFTGSIDEVAVFTRALSATEIASHYAARVALAGWTPSPALPAIDTSTPFGENYAWVAGTSSTPLISGRMTDSSGVAAAPQAFTLTPDGSGPAINWTFPVADAYRTSTAAYTTTWTETEAGSGIGSRSAQWQTAGLANGSCGPFANSGSAFTPSVGSATNSAPVTNTCYRLVVTLTDNVGNVGPSTSPSVTIDTTPPGVPSVPDLAAASDAGASSTDNITNVTTPTFTGTAEAGATVTIFDAATAVGSGVATGGNWSVAASTLTAGAHSITAKATDLAGNQGSASPALSVTLDTTPPGVPSTPDLDAASDSGVSNIDNTTSDATPTFTGTADAATAVTIYDLAAAVGSTATPTGSWSVTTSPLTSALHSVTVKATDTAGNTSAPSTALLVTIDTTGPTADFGLPDEGSTVVSGATSFDVDWTAADTGSGVTASTITREKALADADTCPTAGWSVDLAAAPATSPIHVRSVTLVTCYRWRLELVDGAGNTAVSTSGVVRIGQVALTSLAPGDAVFDVEPLQVDAQAAEGVMQIDFVADGATLASDSTAPYEFDWSTLTTTDGAHDLQARLVPVNGSAELAPPVTVSVNNELPSDDRIRLDRDRDRISNDDRVKFAVYAWGANQMLPSRYRSDSPSEAMTAADITADQFASASSSTQAEITAFLAQDLRGTAYASPPGVQVGRTDPNFPECTFVGGRFLTTTYCKHVTDDGHFELIYHLATPSNVETATPEVDIVDHDLLGTEAAPRPNGVPDVIDKVASSIQEARAAYESWGYRALPAVQKVQFRVNPCKSDGCATNYPWSGPELSILPTTTRPIYLPRHELFHLVQFKYATSFNAELPDGHGLADDNAFWTEATAEWAARKVDAISSHHDPEHNYAGHLAAYLREPTLPLERWESQAEGQRQYGVFIFAAYLSERFGEDFLRQVWDKRASGKTVDRAIDELVVPLNTRIRNVLDDFTRSAYLMDFQDADNATVWVPLLRDDPDSATWQDSLGRARPARTREDLVAFLPVSRSASIDPGGFKILEFVPPNTAGTLHVVVHDDDAAAPPEVHTRAVQFNTYPAVCQESMLEDGAGDVRNWNGVVDIPLGPGACTWAALLVTNSDTLFFDNKTRTITYTAEFFPGSAFDTFDRLQANGWGTGNIGVWQTRHPSHDQYLSVDGTAGVANQIAPLAAGDLAIGVQHALTDPTATAIDLEYTFRQSAPGNPTSPFIDNAFYVASDLGLSGPWAATEIYRSPSSQYQNWKVDIGDGRGLDAYIQGTFTPSPFGDPVKLRMRVDAFGTYAKLWMAGTPEPAAWTASYTRPTALPPGWFPSWIVVEPRQTNDAAGSQTFKLDNVQITSGAAP